MTFPGLSCVRCPQSDGDGEGLGMCLITVQVQLTTSSIPVFPLSCMSTADRAPGCPVTLCALAVTRGQPGSGSQS